MLLFLHSKKFIVLFSPPHPPAATTQKTSPPCSSDASSCGVANIFPSASPRPTICHCKFACNCLRVFSPPSSLRVCGSTDAASTTAASSPSSPSLRHGRCPIPTAPKHAPAIERKTILLLLPLIFWFFGGETKRYLACQTLLLGKRQLGKPTLPLLPFKQLW